MDKDISTEERIKKAAKKVFLKKGYGQARTRDIAEEAGINLALLNYYFRSKEKLFEIVMEESLQQIFFIVKNIIDNKETSLSDKIDQIVNKYMDELLANPNLPLFVLSELQANPKMLLKKIGVPKNMIAESYFYKQMQEQMKSKDIDIEPLHIFINIISMSVFPIVSKYLIMSMNSKMTDHSYSEFIEQRRILIPKWIKKMLKIKA